MLFQSTCGFQGPSKVTTHKKKKPKKELSYVFHKYIHYIFIIKNNIILLWFISLASNNIKTYPNAVLWKYAHLEILNCFRNIVNDYTNVLGFFFLLRAEVWDHSLPDKQDLYARAWGSKTEWSPLGLVQDQGGRHLCLRPEWRQCRSWDQNWQMLETDGNLRLIWW